MAVKFTKDQINAIDAKGTVLVSAAAGSGKTAVLTERVIRKLADEKSGISADRLLIVTFTNASALEMRVRISKRLDELCNEHPSNTHLLKQRLLLRTAKICTIDAYCIELIRTHFALLCINPDFAIAEDSQTSAIKEQCLNEVLSKRYKEKNNNFEALSLLFGFDRSEKNLFETVFKIHDFCMCMPQPDTWLKNAAIRYDCDSIENCDYAKVVLSQAIEVLNNAADTMIFLIKEISGTDLEKPYLIPLNDAYDSIKNMISNANVKSWDVFYDLVLNFNISLGRVSKTDNAKLKEIVSGNCKKILAKIKTIAKNMTGPETNVLAGLNSAKPVVSELLNIVTEFKELYFKTLNARNLLTFSHIEQLAFKLLCDEKDGILVPSKISREICKEFDEVLVDEYQDNNNLQDALFMALSDEGRHLFMVGDVKQSIYGFRNANPDNFLKHKDDYALFDGETSPSKVILKENFRSRSGVCDFVNAFCNTVMKKATCGMDYTDEEELKPSAKYCKSEAADVSLLINEIAPGRKREQTDAEKIADYIEKIVAKPPFLKGDKDDVSILRKAEYKDIVILLRSPGQRAKYYIDALKEKGIPVSYSTGDFYDSPEILSAMSLLKVIDNPMQDIPLLSSMMSVMFGFTADDMAQLRSNYRYGSLYLCVCSAAKNGDEHCKRFLETLDRLRTVAATVSVSRMLSVIYKETMLPELMSADPQNKQAKENLQRLVSVASAYESKTDGGIAGFVAEFERMSNTSKNSGSNVKTDMNAVKIMSFHGSKGLQFPICIVADCGGSFNKTDIYEQMILNENLGLGLKFVDEGENSKSTSIARESLSILHSKKLIAEEIRLMYVALTRAEEKLVISLSVKSIQDKIISGISLLGVEGVSTSSAPVSSVNSADGYSDWLVMTALLQKSGDALREYIEGNTDICNGQARFDVAFSKTIDASESTGGDIRYSMAETDKIVNEDLVKEIKQRFDFVYPNIKASKTPSKMAVTELVHGNSNKFAFTKRPEFMSKSGLTPAERGTAAHRFMQFADYKKAEISVTDEIERLKEWEYISFEEAGALDADALQKFFKSDVYSRIKNASEVKREYKFMVEYPYQDDTTIIQGIADCVFFEDDGLVILDFKTDRVNDLATLSELYSGQLAVYKYALEKILGKKVKECVLYSLYLCQEVKC